MEKGCNHTEGFSSELMEIATLSHLTSNPLTRNRKLIRMKRLLIIRISNYRLCLTREWRRCLGLQRLTQTCRHMQSTGKFIVIPKGSSPGTVVKKLAAEGIIKHEWPLNFILKGTGKVQASKPASTISLRPFRR